MSVLFSWVRISILSCLLIVMVVGFWTYNRHLPSATPAEAESATHQAIQTALPGRDVEHVILHTETLGDIGMTLNLPNPQPPSKMPILMLIGGPSLTAQQIAALPDPGPNVVVGFDWPLPNAIPVPEDMPAQAAPLYNKAIRLPDEIGAEMNWLALQSWADGSRLSLMGFGTGAWVVPAAEEETQRMGFIVRWTVIAHGGAPLSSLVEADNEIEPDSYRKALSFISHITLHPLDADLHVANCTGHFLLLENPSDPEPLQRAEARLRDAVPQPVTEAALDAGDGKQPLPTLAYFAKAYPAAAGWLISQTALNPM